MEIKLEGQDALFAALGRFERQAVMVDAKAALKRAGADIIADAQDNLRRNDSVATGLLRQSGRVEEDKADGGIKVGFFSGEANYAGAVEYGRRSGKMPPSDMIYAWLRKKTRGSRGKALRSATVFSRRSEESLLRSAAYALARHIGKHGTKPHPFFVPAVKKNEQRVLKAISDAISRTINRYGV